MQIFPIVGQRTYYVFKIMGDDGYNGQGHKNTFWRRQTVDVRFTLLFKYWCSGGASAVKEPGLFDVRKSSSQVTRMHFLPQKVDDLFSCGPQNTGRQRRFTVKITQIKRSDMVTLLLFTLLPKQSNTQGLSQGLNQGGGSSSQVIWHGAPWCSAATVFMQLGHWWFFKKNSVLVHR